MGDALQEVEDRIAAVQAEIDALDRSGDGAMLTEQEAAWSDRQLALEIEKLKTAMAEQTRMLQKRDETLLVLLQRAGAAAGGGGVLGSARDDAVVLANLRGELAGYVSECAALDKRKAELQGQLTRAHEALLSGIDAGFEKDVKLHFTKKSLQKIQRATSPSPRRAQTVTPPPVPGQQYRFNPSASPPQITSMSPPARY